MKTKRYRLVGAIFACVLFSGNLTAEEFKKNIHKDFEANENTQLMIDNKYGNIDMLNWDKNQVAIDVTITVDCSSESKADELLKNIDVEFSVENNEIKAITLIDDRFNKSMNEIFNGCHDYLIYYKVMMPENINVKVTNKYGNVFLNKSTGLVSLDLKYGDLKINEIGRSDTKPLNNITLSYGNATIDKCQWVDMNLAYSNMEVNTFKVITLNSRYSKYDIGDGSSLAIEGKYDTYKIGNIKNIVASVEYSNFKIHEVLTKADFTIKYTNVKAEEIKAGFDDININNAYGAIKLGIEPSASYKLDGTGDYCDINFPEKANVSRIVTNNSIKVNGLIGNDNKTNSTVKIISKYGNVTLTGNEE